MELTCPACRARYAVQDADIPRKGRVVRCSACSAEWIARAPAAAPASPAPASPVPAAPAPAAEPAARAPADPGPRQGEPRPVLRQPSRPPLEPAPDWRPVTARPDLHGARPSRDRAERPRPAEEPARETRYAPAAAMAGSLESEDEPRERSRGGGAAFMAGFALVALVALAAAVAYVKRDDLSAAAPVLAEPLEAYADAVDRGRLALEGLADSARSRLGEL